MRPLPSAVSLLRDAWEYLRKHPVLSHVLVWFLVIPAIASAWVDRWGAVARHPASGLLLEDILRIALLLLSAGIAFWGWACVLFVGRRMVQNRAGRSRSSFRRTRMDALPLLLPLLLTALLQMFFMFYRALLYIVPAILVILIIPTRVRDARLAVAGTLVILLPLLLPAILFAIRTSFAPAVVACEKKAGRAALRRSSALFRGRLSPVAGRLIALWLLAYAPAWILATLIDFAGNAVSPQLSLVTDVTDALLSSLALLFFTLGTVRLYGLARGKGATVVEVVPD